GARVIEYNETVLWRAIAEHWNGSQWSIDYAVPAQVLYGVEALGPNNVWAVGTDSYGPIILRYDGSSWSTIATPEWGRGGRLAGIDSVMALTTSSLGQKKRELWAAGNYRPGQGPSRTLIQRAPSTTQGAVLGSTNVSGATVAWFGPENGSTETDPFGDYEVGGLTAGTYTFTATYPTCGPDSATVTVLAGQTIDRDFHINCGGRAGRARARARPMGRRTP
ncbi:MAG TPA: carboxypeptidase-like regulatory domain-containing protein, partial [Gaiellaceae bacterium]|nr:carboxypeptidase-like regulatory domain-containing protein [Gaiellaceae bacterium]